MAADAIVDTSSARHHPEQLPGQRHQVIAASAPVDAASGSLSGQAARERVPVSVARCA